MLGLKLNHVSKRGQSKQILLIPTARGFTGPTLETLKHECTVTNTTIYIMTYMTVTSERKDVLQIRIQTAVNEKP